MSGGGGRTMCVVSHMMSLNETPKEGCEMGPTVEMHKYMNVQIVTEAVGVYMTICEEETAK